MGIYNMSYENLSSNIKDIFFHLSNNYEHMIILYSMLICLIGMLFISKKLSKIEKIQFNDIDDITSYNRLIDEEIGILRKGQDELSQELNRPAKKIDITGQSKLFENAPYTQAVQLAKRGYAREDIISLCSLTESEVELIIALHSSSKAA